MPEPPFPPGPEAPNEAEYEPEPPPPPEFEAPGFPKTNVNSYLQ